MINKLHRVDSFKVYEWLKAKQVEIEEGKFTKLQLAQAAGEHIGKLVGICSLEAIMSDMGIKFNGPKRERSDKGTGRLASLEARIANIEKQLGITV